MRMTRDVQHFQNPCLSFDTHVWYSEFCGYCPLFTRSFFPYEIVHFCIIESHRTQISGWVCLHFWFCFSRDRASCALSSSSILKDKEIYKTGCWCLIWRMLRARSIYFKPFIYAAFMIYAEAGQPCYCISLLQFFQAYCTFPSILTQHILIIGNSWLC